MKSGCRSASAGILPFRFRRQPVFSASVFFFGSLRKLPAKLVCLIPRYLFNGMVWIWLERGRIRSHYPLVMALGDLVNTHVERFGNLDHVLGTFVGAMVRLPLG